MSILHSSTPGSGGRRLGILRAVADSSLLFDDLFTITNVDKDGKKFDRVSRLNASSTNHSMTLVLDFNVELYPLKVGDSFALALSSSLTPEGEKDSGIETQSWRLEEGKGGLADEYEYVMYGKLYKFDSGASDSVTAYISFGGLLMALTGDYRLVPISIV
ncbi:DNA-directed RNA polymerases I, II, and III subunit RPABC3 [Puccinia graminis f. sp. tritici]|uniref:DNA-directed RNA polymerases I, II, and III subunit RPABC3 n=1 Tax=Puccinia graminis f. sp. tritici TaxID=56615 RepID=A0A5B0M6H9_PUCGR|nr:DNA-directed RNA polymerases I, II, and III subunit RPABC3 [Puccinia graminis f. sp. tritici]